MLKKVSVDFSKSHDRIPRQDPGLEDSISQVRTENGVSRIQ